METFKNNYLVEAINIAFRIFKMNSSRHVIMEEEESEKSILNLSIIAFLKFVSMDTNTAKVLLELGKQNDTLRSML